MVSNQVLQSTIEGIKEISHLELGIMDADGREVAVTAPVFADVVSAIPDFAVSPADSQSAGPYQFFKVMDEQQLEYAQFLADLDVDLVIGSHAHIMQPIRYYTGPSGKQIPVVFGLSDFITGWTLNAPSLISCRTVADRRRL